MASLSMPPRGQPRELLVGRALLASRLRAAGGHLALPESACERARRATSGFSFSSPSSSAKSPSMPVQGLPWALIASSVKRWSRRAS